MNQKILKAGGLLLLVGIPVFFFVFLKLFGENKYELPYILKDDIQKWLVQDDKCNSDRYTYVADSIYLPLGSFKQDFDINFSLKSARVLLIINSEDGLEKVLNDFNSARKKLKTYHSNYLIFGDSLQLSYFKEYFELQSQMGEDLSINDKFVSTDNLDNEFFIDCIFPSYVLNQFADESVINSSLYVLLDHIGAIRGVYNANISEEVDRMIIETDLLVNKVIPNS
ncbi:MAG: hypothetical protein LAT68_02455 [Cyclobacteriaceae bacterium]|nr:hypothetical protein [Cyclobacteriaceae bacterium]MCH8515166.1 hypothetical protein [Cyclobacteriaceae bacterium]